MIILTTTTRTRNNKNNNNNNGTYNAPLLAITVLIKAQHKALTKKLNEKNMQPYAHTQHKNYDIYNTAVSQGQINGLLSQLVLSLC